MSLTADELSRAAVTLAKHLRSLNIEYSISGGCARSLLRYAYDVEPRLTNDIDLVVRPIGDIDAEAVSKKLHTEFPAAFGTRSLYGVAIPTVILARDDGTKVEVDIEMFDVRAWPNRPQYDLTSSENEVIQVDVLGEKISIFGPRWQLREKMVTAYQRSGSLKERTDLDDVEQLLDLVEEPKLDMSKYADAVRHVIAKRPGLREQIQLVVYCRTFSARSDG